MTIPPSSPNHETPRLLAFPLPAPTQAPNTKRARARAGAGSAVHYPGFSFATSTIRSSSAASQPIHPPTPSRLWPACHAMPCPAQPINALHRETSDLRIIQVTCTCTCTRASTWLHPLMRAICQALFAFPASLSSASTAAHTFIDARTIAK